MEDTIILPPEIYCNIFSDVSDIRTLVNIKRIGGDLFETAAYCVKSIQTDEYEYVNPNVVTAYYNVKSVGGIIDISTLSDVINIASHTSLQSAIIKFNFSENVEINMLNEFLTIYLHDINRLKTTNIMFLLNHDRYIYISKGILYVVYQNYVETDLSAMLYIIINLLSTGTFSNVYILLNWILMEGDIKKKDLYEQLNTLSTPINLIIPEEYEYDEVYSVSEEEFLSYPVKYLRRVNIIWNKIFNELDPGIIFNEPSDTLEYLTGPFDFPSTSWHFQPDNNMVYAPHLNTLGYILPISLDILIMDIDLHPNIRTVILYTMRGDLVDTEIVMDDRKYIFKKYPKVNLNPIIIFNKSSAEYS